MGQATRTTKLLLDLGKREEGGANAGKRANLEATAGVLNQARAFYVDFFLAHAQKLAERVSYYSEKHVEMRTRAIPPNELLTWAEAHTVATRDHPHPWEGWNFSERFPGMPFAYRRAAIKDAIGKARSYLSNLARWEKSGKKPGKPGVPGAANHPRSTKERSSWTSPAEERSTRGLCASKSIRARTGNGVTIPSSTAAIFSNA
jgi:putative transposase